MRLLTWNIWGIGPDKSARSAVILEHLRSVGADVMGFQEVVLDSDGTTFLDSYAEEIGGSIIYGPSPDGFDSPMRNAIVSKHPIRRSASSLLDSGRDVKFRSVVMADVALPEGSFRFYTTHLDHRLHASELRQKQLAEIVGFMQEHEPADSENAPVLAGDLNALPDSDEIRRLVGSSSPHMATGRPRVFIDVWAAVGSGDGNTWSNSNALLGTPQWPNRRLDYIMIGYPIPAGRGRPLSAWLTGLENPGSDHFAVVADLS